MKFLAREDTVNVTDGYRFGESDVFETQFETIGEAFRGFRSEHGRCTGRVYLDTQDGTHAIGWVFLKRRKYDDAPSTFLAETWVTIHAEPPTVVRHEVLVDVETGAKVAA